MRVKEWSELTLWQKIKVGRWLNSQFDKWQQQVISLHQHDEFSMTEADKAIRSTTMKIIAFLVSQYNSPLSSGDLLQNMYSYLKDTVSYDTALSSIEWAVYMHFHLSLIAEYSHLGLLEE